MALGVKDYSSHQLHNNTPATSVKYHLELRTSHLQNIAKKAKEEIARKATSVFHAPLLYKHSDCILLVIQHFV